MRYVTLALLLSVAANAQAQNVDRYWGEFEIARIQLTARPFDGGAGTGLSTSWVPIFAQAIIRVEEAQNFTWEWIGITPPGELLMENFPNLAFSGTSGDSYEFAELTMDLNPVSPNKWGSLEEIRIPYPELSVVGSYASFSTTTDFDVTYELRLPVSFGSGDPENRTNTPIDMYFSTVVTSVDFSRFPDELTATIQNRKAAQSTSFVRPSPQQVAFNTSQQVILEPKLELGPVRVQQFRRDGQDCSQGNQFNGCFSNTRTLDLTHTPAGDANNDGKVSFDDFLILSGNFQVAEAARWDDGDFDEDGDVDFSDFLSLSTNFNSGVAAVPEPSSGALAMLAGAGLGVCRRRR